MNDKLIEICKRHGGIDSRGVVIMAHDDFQSFAADLVKPYVEALEFYAQGDHLDSGQDVDHGTVANNALTAHQEFIGYGQ